VEDMAMPAVTMDNVIDIMRTLFAAMAGNRVVAIYCVA
jgi:hypothetical protein